jgi:hypothetical protein
MGYGIFQVIVSLDAVQHRGFSGLSCAHTDIVTNAIRDNPFSIRGQYDRASMANCLPGDASTGR